MPARDVIQVRVTRDLFSRARSYLLRDARERLCFLLGNTVESEGFTGIVLNRLLAFSDDCYLRQESSAVVLSPGAKNHIYHEFCRAGANVLVNCHSHPFSIGHVHFSSIDDADDRREGTYLYEHIPPIRLTEGVADSILVLSMVFGQAGLAARTLSPSGAFGPVAEVVVVGDRIERILPSPVIPEPAAEEVTGTDAAAQVYDRQRTLVGEEVQDLMQGLGVGVVGVGGVGSVLVEGLVRVGFRRLTLVDSDRLEETNLNRWQGARKCDVGRLKVDVAGQRLREMFPDVTIEEIAASVYAAESVSALKRCDLLFGAVDNHVARYFLNRLSVQYLVPYIDGATRIYSEPGGPLRFALRLAVILPGASACLNCSQIRYLDGTEVAHALYDPDTRSRLRASGYLEDAPAGAETSILPLNACLSSIVLMESLNLFSRWRPVARSLSLDWNAPEQMCSRGDAENFPERPAADCLHCAGYLATGDSEPLPVPRGLEVRERG